VDPGDAGPAIAWLDTEKLPLSAILITHHHNDHCGGIQELCARWPCPVYGPQEEPICGLSHPVHNGDQIHIQVLNLDISVIATPGHTIGHVCYLVGQLLFAGDTLFACGCGRLFEGTPAQMYDSLKRLASLPAETKLYCAHEYTLANLAFALELEPEHTGLQARAVIAAAQRKLGIPTLPSTIGDEKRWNPFLRCDQPELVMALSNYLTRPLQPGLESFTALRSLKDTF
jgi:hydroxyacylglutathione hydrolase